MLRYVAYNPAVLNFHLCAFADHKRNETHTNDFLLHRAVQLDLNNLELLHDGKQQTQTTTSADCLWIHNVVT